MDEFLNLEAKEVGRWISSDEISVAVEADVFMIVLKWIERNESERRASFEQLFRHVRLAFLSRDFLIDVVTNELVEENSDCLRLLCTFRSIIFFKSGFLSQNIGRSVIFNLKKNILKKTKFWRRNRSFTFTPEVKVYPLIDSPMMLCNQPRRLSRD